jgi:hypothetical protein
MHHQIVIVGGGNGGVSVAAQLRKALKQQDIAIIEPCRKHYYQPLWTLVGAGVFPKEVTEREEESYIPEGTTWIQDAVTEFQPDDNTVLTRDGKKVSYDFLVVAPGIQIDWDKIGGLKGNIGRYGICSNFAYEYVDKTWEYIRNFKGGNAIFNFPNTPIKCAGAPQKIMYLADDIWPTIISESQVCATGQMWSTPRQARRFLVSSSTPTRLIKSSPAKPSRPGTITTSSRFGPRRRKPSSSAWTPATKSSCRSR